MGRLCGATPLKTHPSSGWISSAWSQLSPGAHSASSYGQEPAVRAKAPMGGPMVKPQSFQPAFWSAENWKIHTALGVCSLFAIIYIYMFLSMNDFLPGCLFAVVIKCFMTGVNVWWVYLAPQNIPCAISVLTLVMYWHMSYVMCKNLNLFLSCDFSGRCGGVAQPRTSRMFWKKSAKSVCSCRRQQLVGLAVRPVQLNESPAGSQTVYIRW